MKKTIIIMTITFILLLLSACYVPFREKYVCFNDRDDLFVLFAQTVPFLLEHSSDPHRDIEIYPIETDEYGRTLGIMQFNQKERNPLFGENAVYCVLQSGSEKESCFYEDVCCIMVENGADPGEAIAQLKQNNDWNQPLALEKCLQIPIEYCAQAGVYETSFDYSACNQLADEATGWDSNGPWLEVLCKDGHGLWLFTMERSCYEENSPVVMIMMREELSADDDDPVWKIIDIRPLENRTSPWEEIHTFKEDMGWQFVNPAQSK